MSANAVTRLARLRRYELGLLVGRLQESIRESIALADRLQRENAMLRLHLTRRDMQTRELTVTCGCCEGAGVHGVQVAVDDWDETKCDRCSGTGSLPACDVCRGDGERAGGMCMECNGEGYVESGATCGAREALANVIPFKSAADFR